jgi:hypothetical protein
MIQFNIILLSTLNFQYLVPPSRLSKHIVRFLMCSMRATCPGTDVSETHSLTSSIHFLPLVPETKRHIHKRKGTAIPLQAGTDP